MKKLKIAFLGGGINSAVGQVHRIAVEMDKKFELVAGCFSKNEKINLQTAKIYDIDIKRCYNSLEELIKYEKNNIDAISILTPIPNHKNEIIKCLDNNIKVICEKAIALSVEEASEIKKALKRNNGFLAVIYNYTGYPMLRELKHMIKNNKLGKINQIHIEMPQESFIKLNKNPQDWRLKDYILPTIYLDLASHIHNIIYFLIEEKPLEIIAINNNFGNFNVIDNTIAIINYTGNVVSNIWFSKSAIGHRNGLKVRVYGEKGSATWYQMKPENLYFCDNTGNKFIIDRESPNAIISKKKRYNRFKAGHPIGFIEAFANYYCDIYDSILHNQLNEYVFGIEEAIEGLKLLTAMNKSSKNKKWENIQ
ncbi:conserved hypothetical protein [Lebetimonas natsushimae]|uniref:Gfo/Idh/MocA family oxidoreductase n=1 Tax=Lebetimonas natsushimae TaxID=1936991 RepID=A0A292YEN7_9BACT|nr:Gfo/Idh/MocA family oxidoreductase [Lebetimonas natsushimae]GAX87605.1 conserved hypothetical protein [Lebetimonas natsushimae]